MKKVVAIIVGLALLLSLNTTALAVKKDTLSPSVTNSYPYDSQRNVMVESKLIIRFSEDVVKGRAFSLLKVKDSDGKLVSFTYELKGNILQLIPRVNLYYDSEYFIDVPAHAVKDVNGNELQNEFTVTFMTENKAAAYGSLAQEQQEEGKSTHTIKFDAVIQDTLDTSEQAYLIAAFRSFGILINDIRVEDAEEPEEEKPEEPEEEAIEDTVEETDGEIEYTEFDVYLVDPGPTKIQLIRIIRALTGLGLKEAKDLVDGTASGPKIVKSGISSEEANQCVDKIEEQGGTTVMVGHGEIPY